MAGAARRLAEWFGSGRQTEARSAPAGAAKLERALGAANEIPKAAGVRRDIEQLKLQIAALRSEAREREDALASDDDSPESELRLRSEQPTLRPAAEPDPDDEDRSTVLSMSPPTYRPGPAQVAPHPIATSAVGTPSGFRRRP